MESKDRMEITEHLESSHDCYVLITCDPCDEEGAMNVQMNYSGDPALASYLIQGAQEYFEEECMDIGESG